MSSELPVASSVESPLQQAQARLGAFRSRPALVPLDDGDGLLTVSFGGLDWICAFTDEDALARFAHARDEAGREWTYRKVTGALLLDEVVPAAGFPCGVALDAAGPDPVMYPPLRGIVPDRAALDGGDIRPTGPLSN
ncbi:SseB family protein [Streptomyces sp. NPDC003860]